MHQSPSHAAHDHGPTSFWTKYIFSQDHKIIGIQFMFVSFLFMILGGFMAMMIRWQLAYPDRAFPLAWMVPSGVLDDGHITPPVYNQLFTMHGTIMIFFVIIPMLTGAFGNFLIPLMIGARDMAFPKLNMLSYWVMVPAALVITSSFFVPQGPAAAGWTNYPPLSYDPQWTGVGRGHTLWLIALLLSGTSSIMGSMNYITTVVNLRAPGMTFFRLPLSIWALFVTAILQLMATPVLASALGMLLLDRTVGTHFFAPAGGGQVILWQHIFWFYSHPAVYIMILPTMGFTSDVLATFARKPIFGYKAMAYSMMGIAGLGFIVWGHHMFQSGMNPTLGTTFTAAMLNAMSFVSMFIIGGLSGIFMASTPVDMFIHDTYFIVAHLHYVLFGGSLFGIFAAVHYWFPKMFGRMMSETLGKVHFWLTFVFYNLTFFPMHILGMGGMMRRIYDPTQYDFLKPLQPMNIFVSHSAFLLGSVQILFIINFVWGLFRGRKAERNPWHANTLEWVASSPPPHGNFEAIPTVYRGPYEYSSLESQEDYLPQDVPSALPAGAPAHVH